MGRARRRAPRDEGAAAVEFAIVAPLVFMLLFWTFEFGWELWEIQAAQSSAGQVARNAAIWVPSETQSAFVKKAACQVSRTGVGAGRLTQVKVAFSTGPAGTPAMTIADLDGYATVTLTYTSSLAGLLPTPLTGSDGTYASTAVARLEQLPPADVLPGFSTTPPGNPCA